MPFAYKDVGGIIHSVANLELAEQYSRDGQIVEHNVPSKGGYMYYMEGSIEKAVIFYTDSKEAKITGIGDGEGWVKVAFSDLPVDIQNVARQLGFTAVKPYE